MRELNGGIASKIQLKKILPANTPLLCTTVHNLYIHFNSGDRMGDYHQIWVADLFRPGVTNYISGVQVRKIINL